MADYPITAVERRTVLSGSAGTGPYAFNFPILIQTDLDVYKDATKLTLTTNYTVSIGSAGTGTVTLVDAATGDNTITIVGARAIQRTTDFVTAGDLLASSLNTELDSQTIFAQQTSEDADRAIKAPVTDPTSIDMSLPAKATRATKVLGFDSDGDPTVSTLTLAAMEAGATTATTKASEAASSATAAASSATASASSATASANSATASAGSATTSAATATTLSGAASTTSLAIGTGAKAFTVAAGLAFQVGDFLLATSNANTANYMHGQVASYSGTTLTLTSANVGGSGTLSDWTIRRSGPLGPVGATGSQGATGAGVTSLTTRGDLLAQGASAADRLAIGSANTVLTTAGTDPAWSTIATAMIADDAITLAKMAGGTDGNLITYDASGNPAYVAAGSATQVLTSQGAGSVPVFAAAAGGGKVLQIVTATSTAKDSSTSTTFVDTSLACSITPTATTSKFWVNCTVFVGALRSDGAVYAGVTRFKETGVTDDAYPASNYGFGYGFTNDPSNSFGHYIVTGSQMQWLHDPDISDTSALTYTCQHKVLAGTSYFNYGGTKTTAVITVTEIGA